MKIIACNVCGSTHASTLVRGTDRLFRTDDAMSEYVKCDRCGLVYMNPQLEPDELTKYYPAEYGPYQTEYELLAYGPLLGWLKKMFGGKRIEKKRKESPAADESIDTYLDFGCGSGANMEKVRRKHPRWDIRGLDISEHASAAARAKGFTVYHGDLSATELPQRFFDHVYMSHVIEHLPDPKAVLTMLRQSMKPGSRFTLSTPNVDSAAFGLFRTYWYALDAPRHLFLFSPKTLTVELEEASFSVESISFDREPKTAIRSLAYLLYDRPTGIPAWFWHFSWYLFTPLSMLLAATGKTSIMTVHARAR